MTSVKRVYLDYAATTPLHPEVKQEMMEALEGTYGNPSSIHSFGRESRKLLDEARAKLHGVSEPIFLRLYLRVEQPRQTI